MKTKLTLALSLILLASVSVNAMTEGFIKKRIIRNNLSSISVIKEAEIRLESWMIRPFADTRVSQSGENLRPESWMLRTAEFLAPLEQVKEPEPVLEHWMTSPFLQTGIEGSQVCETEVHLEPWMLGF